MRRAILLLAVPVVAGCGGSAPKKSASTAAAPKPRAAAPCRNSEEGRYEARSLACVNGLLVRAPLEAPQLRVTNPRMPPAQGLPAGTARITLPISGNSWTPGVEDMAVGNRAVWVASGAFGIRPGDSGAPKRLAPRSSALGDVAAGDGAIWASDFGADRVLRFDARGRKLVAKIRFPSGSGPEAIATTPGAVWVAGHHAGTLSRIDPRTNRIVGKVVLTRPGDSGPQGVATGDGSIWVGVPSTNSVFRVNPATNQIAAIIPTPIEPCGDLAVTRTAVWVSSCLDDSSVARIDPATNRVKSILGLGNVVQPAADGDSVWMVGGGDGESEPHQMAYLLQLRPDDTVQRRFRVGPGFVSGGSAVAFGSIWISDFAKPRVLRIPLAR